MEKILKRVYENKKLSLLLKIFSHISVIFTFLAFCIVTLLVALKDPISAVKICAVILADFLVISLVRWLIDAPRPYEIYDFYDAPPKKRQGLSFPSRHTSMAFAIATVLMPLSPVLGILVGLFGLLLAVCRVLTGIHFIRDVAVGALLGIISSALGVLIFSI